MVILLKNIYLKCGKVGKISLIVFLIDIRHAPTANDKLMYDYIIRSGLPCIILANKADKIAPSKVDEIIGMTANEDITEDTLLTYEMLE